MEAAAQPRPRKRGRKEAAQPEPVCESDSLFQLSGSEKPDRKVTEFFMAKSKRANATAPTECVATAGNSAGSATAADDALLEVSSNTVSAEEMGADFGRVCDELEAALKPENAAPPPDRVSDEQAGAPTVTTAGGALAASPRSPEAKGVNDTDEILADLCRFDLTESNLKQFEDVLSKAHVQNDEPAHPLLAAFTKASVDGEMPARGLVAQRFRRAHPADTAAGAEYLSAKAAGREAAKQFRIRWAAAERNKIKETQTYSESWKRVDTTRGKYKAFGRIVCDEGGWDDRGAVAGAKELARKCLAMGGQWVKRHPQTNRLIFMHLEFEWAEDMERAWSLFQSSEVVQGGEGHGAASSAGHCVGDSGGNTPRDNDVVDVHAAGEQGKCAKGKETPSKTSKAKDNKAKDGSEHGEDAGDKKILASKFAQATKLKTTFLQLTSKAITVREQIEANPEWLWAKNEANLGRLISSLEALKSALGEFDSNFIMKPVSSLRRGMTKERLTVGLEAFMLLEAPLSQLQKSVDGLLAMHAARGA